VPSFCFDAVYYDDGAAQHFIEELRWGFSAGGFPLWQQLCKNPSFYIPFEYRPDFPAIVDDLTRDLFPICTF
jgi:hypothetical protein